MNFAIIGCGIIAQTHAAALKQLKDDGCVLYGACDIIPQKADDYAKEHGAKKVYYNYEDAINDDEVDIVCVCVPSGLHGEVCIAAARANKAIVCEKPMEITPHKIEAVIEEVNNSGVKMQCIFQRRLMPVAQIIKKAVSDGKLGKITMACADLKYYRDDAYYKSADWRATWDLDGGGALMNQGVHGVDLILWMINDEIDTVYGSAKTMTHDIEVEDNAAALLIMKSGALCTIQSSTSAYPGFSTTFSIHGELGSVSFNDEQILHWNFIDEADAPQRPDIGERIGGDKNAIQIGITGHVNLLKDIATALKEDKEPMIPVRDSMTAVKTICTIYESSRTGKPIKY